MSRDQGRRKWAVLAVTIFAVVLAGLGFWLGPLVGTAWRAGFLDHAEERQVTVDVEDNLKRIHQALMLYAESEGQLPEAEGWMDAAWLRLKTADMKEEEAKKLLKSRPDQGPESYGFAMNSSLSKKDPFSLDKSLPLIFVVDSGEWNGTATESQKGPGASGRAITVGGDMVWEGP